MKISIQNQLRQEFIRKSAWGGIFHLIIALIAWGFFHHLNSQGPLWITAFAVIGATGLWRFLTRGAAETVTASFEKLFFQHAFLLNLSAALWGGLGAHAILSHGLYSVEAVTCSFIICTLLSGAVPAVSANLFVHRIYIGLMIAFPTIAVLWQATTSFEYSIATLFVGYAIYLNVVAVLQHKGLQRSIEYRNRMIEDKDKLQQVVNSVPGFVFSLDQDFNILEHSIGLDIKMSESFKFDLTKNLHLDIESILYKEIYKFIHSKIVSSTHEVLLTENSHPAWYLISMTKNTQINGATVIVGIPINDLKQTQEQLKIQTSKAEFSARLATLGEMAGGIAHEINNPLAVIMGNATQVGRLLDAEVVQPPLVKEKAQKIIQTCLRISKIVQGLRQFSRQGDQDPFIATSIQQVINDTLELCRERFYRYGVNILIEALPENVQIPARAVQISQVLLNILNNAFDALNEQKDNENKFIQLSFKRSADHLSIFIADSGPGIPETVANRIFEPFFTTKEVGKGTGLGLSISKGIIEDHKGELILHRETGLTTFEIKLPLMREETQPIPRSPFKVAS